MGSEHLGVNLDGNVVECAQGLGHYNNNKLRHIIVKFTPAKFKESVLSAAYKLKDTSSNSEDPSPAFRETRSRLLAFAKAQDTELKLRFNQLFIGDRSHTFDAAT